jgi:ADP-heptose:LPS heptosyltransferase
MNTSQMRIIDFHLGNALCLILDAYERLRKIFVKPAESPVRIKNILVTKYLGMGSILLATPTLRALRDAYPESRIVFLTFESNYRFAQRLSVIDEVRYFRTGSFKAFAKDLFTILPGLRREKFDLVLDLEFFSRFSTIVSYLSGGKIRIGYYLAMIWRGNLLTHLINYNPYRHITEVFASQLEPLGISVTDYSLTPPDISCEAHARIVSLLQDHGIAGDERLIAVNANASDLSIERRWPLEYFVALITEFSRIPDRRMILTGSPEDSEYVASLYARLPEHAQKSVVNLAGRLPLDEFIALLKCVHLCISNDSGPLHIAASLGVPTVSFFGPETPTRYGPIGDNHVVFYADLYCSPCLSVYNAKRAECNGENRCMQQITVKLVLDRLKDKGLL